MISYYVNRTKVHKKIMPKKQKKRKNMQKNKYFIHRNYNLLITSFLQLKDIQLESMSQNCRKRQDQRESYTR